MTRKDYKAIAGVIKRATFEDAEGTPVILRQALLDGLTEILQSDNPRFDRGRFIAACYEH